MDSYICSVWGDQKDNVNLSDVKEYIEKTQNMDQEHGAFWVSLHEENKNVLESHKDLEVIAVFGKENITLAKTFASWKEIEDLYSHFLQMNFDLVKKIFDHAKKV